MVPEPPNPVDVLLLAPNPPNPLVVFVVLPPPKRLPVLLVVVAPKAGLAAPNGEEVAVLLPKPREKNVSFFYMLSCLTRAVASDIAVEQGRCET